MHEFLKNFGISNINTFLDIGANFGENNLYFAKHFPQARNIAVEPSPRNLQTLALNLNSQNFDTTKIEVIRKALSDKSGEILNLMEANSESFIAPLGGVMKFRFPKSNQYPLQIYGRI